MAKDQCILIEQSLYLWNVYDVPNTVIEHAVCKNSKSIIKA